MLNCVDFDWFSAVYCSVVNLYGIVQESNSAQQTLCTKSVLYSTETMFIGAFSQEL